MPVMGPGSSDRGYDVYHVVKTFQALVETLRYDRVKLTFIRDFHSESQWRRILPDSPLQYMTYCKSTFRKALVDLFFHVFLYRFTYFDQHDICDSAIPQLLSPDIIRIREA